MIKDARWSDAATLLDEILASDRDFFFRPDLRKNNWRSIKTEASRLIGTLPPVGREAYALQFRSRAERLLKQAIASNDSSGVVAVARRWFHTPAGQQATMLAALEALEAQQPLAAAAWLDRLKASGAQGFEPTLAIMRAKAWWLAGDRKTAIDILEKVRGSGAATARIGGKDVSLSFAPDAAAALLESIAGRASSALSRQDSEWWLHRGDAARNAVSTATRPLLVPRYRVPLTRHPEEARLLEKRRKLFADRDMPLLPAGKPLAVDGLIVLHTPMGLLAVDFETGKRVWLQTGGAAALWADGRGAGEGGADGVEEAERDETGSMQSVFGDATSGAISSNGRFIFAVETDPLDAARASAPNGMRRIIGGPGRTAGNVLSAYDATAKGALRWRLPVAKKVRDEAGADAEVWYMGAPLTIGDQLFVLVEERGEIRLDVLNAADGGLLWSQPLAELDEEQTADGTRAQLRRMAGLSPSFAEGVLVCPTGAGAVVAVDLATRTLLWASNYAVPAEQAAQVMRFGIRVQIGGLNGRGGVVVNGPLAGGGPASGGGWRDATAILASGRVILGAVDSEKLQCLDLRSGAAAWEVPRNQALYVAGVVDGRVILVGRHAVEALSLADGKRVWNKPTDLGAASPSGRGIVTPGRLFLPVDAPEVIEIDLRDGSIAGRSPARSGVVPGNLVAYRGEVVSQGVDSLDVFHQAAPLEERIETALKRQPPDPWALLWRGQLDLDRGEIVAGMRCIREARAVQPDRIPADIVGDALLFAMRRDFAAAAPIWRETQRGDDDELPHSKALLCLAIDSFLQTDDLAAAWQSCRDFLALSLPEGSSTAGAIRSQTAGDQRPLNAVELLTDTTDASLTVSEPRWFQGRMATLRDKAPAELRAEIDAFVAGRARELLDPATLDPDRLGQFVDYFG
ncbi:MAG: PQQ-binding-like beta-propeller repeat protein, partial [Planctomycetota bacterium]